MINKLGILTSEEHPELLDYDKDIVKLLADKGVKAEILVWENDVQKLRNYDKLLMRTCWGYHLKINDFDAFLKEIEKFNIQLWNPVDVIFNNIHKFYLRDLQEKGIKIIPTYFAQKSEKIDLRSLMDEKQWEKAIIKPAISAGSSNTITVDNDFENAQAYLDNLLDYTDVLIQKFMDDITKNGEWSTIFFSNGYHYTVRKVPQNGDFRVQYQYGGTYRKEEPPENIFNTSKQIADMFLGNCLYARIDGIESEGKFYLMEAELIEPDLYMNIVPEAKAHFVDAIISRFSF